MKKTTALLSVFFMLLSLTGCQLANADLPMGDDTLIGIYVTTKYMDFNQSENQSSDDWNEIGYTDTDRIYGTLTMNETQQSVSFPGIAGYALLGISEQEDGQTFYNNITEAFSDIHQHISDTGFELDGTLYYNRCAFSVLSEEESDESIELYVYMNPVYQTADGQVYLSPQDTTPNFLVSQGSISTSYSSQESNQYHFNDRQSESTVSASKFTATVDGCIPTDQITFTHIDKDGDILKTDTYPDLSHLPETYSWNKKDAYILVTLTAPDGTITYDTINADDESYSFFVPRDCYICEKNMLDITH